MTFNRNISKLGPAVGSNGTVLISNGSAAYWGTVSVNASTGGESSPKISTIYVTDSSYNNLDDTAVDSTSGGYIKITGSGFSAGCVVVIGNIVATSTTYVSSSEVRAQVQAQAAGSYTLYLTNSDGSVAIRVLGINFSGFPSWSTSSSFTLSSTTVNYNFAATSDSTVAYSLNGGSSLPPGLTLSSNGLLSGTFSGTEGTVYSFTLQATDTENQNTPRTFSVTVSAAEPYFNLVSLLVHADGTNTANNNTFIDSSTNNSSITRTGTATQGTFSPFSQTGWSTYFGGSEIVTCPANASNIIGTGDFTIEAWIYLTASGTQGIVASHQTGGMIYLILNSSNHINLGVNNSAGASTSYVDTISAATINLNTWTHVAAIRNGTELSIWINGNKDSNVGSLSAGANIGSYGGPKPFYIGASADGGNKFNGYISNVRFVNGTALYTSTFTPSTTPLTSVTNTRILTCQSNRFIDNGPNGTITLTGSPKIQPFSPFAPTSGYSTSTIGGSTYFNGSTDYLTIPNNTSLGMGAADFTIEFWLYQTALSSYKQILDVLDGNSAGRLILWVDSGGTLYNLGYNGTSRHTTAGGAIVTNTWTHVALVRSSGTTKFYINGTQSGTNYTDSTNYTCTTGLVYIGINSDGSTYPYVGYLSNFRMVKGTAVYTGTFTPPTAPVTAVTNTQFLLNSTNAAIYDQTAKNNLITVSSAQISTSQSKFGGSSMYFNGSTDYLLIPAGNQFAFGTGNFTVEAWVYQTVRTGSGNFGPQIAGCQIYGTNADWLFDITATGYLYFQITGSTSGAILTTSTVPLNIWTHVAVVRSSGTVTIYINGINAGGSASYTTSITNNSIPFTIGCDSSGYSGTCFTGYIDDFRISKYARYTSTFSPPTAAFSDR